MAKRFYPLRIKSVRKETSSAVTICLDVPTDLEQLFRFDAGQHLTVQALIEGEEIRRNYSLCTAPHENQYCITVKRVPKGRFSTYANHQLSAGMSISVMPPGGGFTFPFQAGNKNVYVAFAAGSGITPIISLMKAALATEPHSTFKLFYANRSKDQIIFLEDLEGLKNRYIDRLAIYHVFSQQKQEFELFNGRIDKNKCQQFAQLLFTPGSVDAYFLCGPQSMMAEISGCLKALGVAQEQIKKELFTSPEMLDKIVAETKIKSRRRDIRSTVEIKFDGHVHQISFDQSRSVLDVALEHGLDLPYACKGGVCCTCKAKLIEGSVDMIVNYGLDQDELAQDFILTCQAVPLSEKVVVDYDVI